MRTTGALVAVFDLEQLTLVRASRRDVVSVRTADGEVLAVVRNASRHPAPEVAFRAYDNALAGGGVLRRDPGTGDSVCVPVAFYDRYSGHISLRPVPDTEVFQAAPQLALPATGTLVVRAGDELTGDGFHATLADLSLSALAA